MLDYEVVRAFAEEVIMNYELDGMEAILYVDGENWIRQSGSFGIDEDEIMVKVPLGQSYWGDSYLWGEDLDENEELRESAIEDLINDINLTIEDWKVEQEDGSLF